MCSRASEQLGWLNASKLNSTRYNYVPRNSKSGYTSSYKNNQGWCVEFCVPGGAGSGTARAVGRT